MKQMTLGEIIDVLERKDPELLVRYDFAHFQPSGVHSYRGYYDQLAIGYGMPDGDGIKVAELLSMLRDAVGKTFHGYKGGQYVMDRETPVWVANHNESGGTGVVDVRDGSWCLRLITALVDD